MNPAEGSLLEGWTIAKHNDEADQRQMVFTLKHQQ
jgi:hypothetical protein